MTSSSNLGLKPTDVGVIVGRFQVPYLHEAHVQLIDSIVNTHPKVLIFLGLSPCLVTRNNPLDFESRKRMIQEKYPDVNILYIKDVPCDIAWSKQIDRQISDLVSPGQNVALYGSRDGFISRYSGKYATVELESKVIVSGTEIRKAISKSVKLSPEFRMGVIWAAFNQYPRTIPTVDVAIIRDDEVLLGRKEHEQKYRFIGGFSEPEAKSYEADILKEISEETGCEVDSNLKYLGSTIIDDWRYRGEVDKIKTSFFKTNYIFGAVRAADDISELRWFKLEDLHSNEIVDEHEVLLKMLKADLNTEAQEK